MKQLLSILRCPENERLEADILREIVIQLPIISMISNAERLIPRNHGVIHQRIQQIGAGIAATNYVFFKYKDKSNLNLIIETTGVYFYFKIGLLVIFDELFCCLLA